MEEIPAPTAAQVRAGLSSGGSVVPGSGRIEVLQQGTSYTGSVSGLEKDTVYKVYLVAEDTVAPQPNVQTKPTVLR
eukprot:scaffold129619_cov38-Prasinocladus_malaysianus.AAC.1